MNQELKRLLSETWQDKYKNFSDADIFYQQIIDMVRSKERDIKDNESILIAAHLNNSYPIIVSGFGYKNPDMLMIYGIDGFNEEVLTLCHKSSVQLTIKITTIDTTGAQKQFGFLPPNKD